MKEKHCSKHYHAKPAALLLVLLVVIWSLPAAMGQGNCRQSILESRDRQTVNEPIAVSMKELENAPDDFYGKTVTVEGELHRTFTDKVFTIEDGGTFRDKDILVISTVPMEEAVVALDDELEEGEDVSVTAFVVPYDRGKLECAFGPLSLDSREGHSFTKNPVLIIDRTEPKASQPVELHKPAFTPPDPPTPVDVEPPAPAPTPAPAPAPAPEFKEKTLPKTASPLPLLGLVGLLALNGAILRRRR
jgi:hypothetical protein